ncbi:MAG: radical SAM family heme chaperone HemW [Lachnospiraceae bacterium]|nr:radical SAM family heme chaperone HemW [Lachnospiraceae bacterium]
MKSVMDKKLRLYLHIPFCVRKCKYCDFVSFAGKEEQFEAYVDSLCNEIRVRGEVYKDREISSIYIGGGTPSILPEDLMERIVNALNQSFHISGTKEKRKGFHLQKKIRPVTEFSIECNPGTVDKKKLKAYKKMGINRISFGLQTSDPEGLKALGRIHSFDDFIESFESAREAGFDNINVDLMQAIPEQTLSGWQRTLALLTTWKPEHISAYSLIVEEGTPFYEMQQKGQLILPDEDEEREIYYYTKEFLEKCGYRRYEISNYAIPGFECRHNIGYWKRDDYLGLGLNSSSMVDNLRWKNTEDLSDYMEVFSHPFSEAEFFRGDKPLPEQTGEGEQNVPVSKIIKDVHPLSHKEQMEESMFLGLRMTEGISKQEFFDTFRQDFDYTYGETVLKLKEKGLLKEEEGRVFLTDKGVDISNTVLAEFLLDQ